MPRSAILLGIPLILWSCGKTLGWSEVGRVGAGVLYTNSAAVVRAGTSATSWALIDFKSPQSTKGAVAGRMHLSAKSQYEYDCTFGQLRILSVAYYSGNMGEGEIISTAVEHEGWIPVVPGSTEKTLWDAICGKA